MTIADNVLDEIQGRAEAVLKSIQETSYGVSTHDLWELLGGVKATLEFTLSAIERVKSEINDGVR